MPYRAVLFDLDGTLLDTLADLGNAMNRVLAARGHPPHDIGKYRYFVGDGAVALVERTLPEDCRDGDTVDACLEEFRKDYRENWNVETQPYSGVAEMLDALTARGVKMAVFSNKPDEFTKLCATKLLANWTFEVVFGQRKGVRLKPHPDAALEIARILGIEPHEFLYVGDTAVDMRTAVAAGMFPVGVLWGFRPTEELLEGGAQALIERPQQLLDLLDHAGPLHVHCGDSSAASLRRSRVGEAVIVWCDPLMEGPVPEGKSDEELRHVRAEYLGRLTGKEAATCLGWLAKQEKALERFADHREVVLWFDACLFDQVILIRQLDWFARRALGETKLSLICVGEFPGFDRFRGLGELSPDQLTSLLDTRHDVTPAETELAVRAWPAFRSPDPTAIARLLESDTSALPYLAAALTRHLEQFPSVRNGLNRLENAALEVIAEGHSKLGEIFSLVSGKEAPAFFGDTSLWARLDEMATAEVPLLTVEGPSRLPRWDREHDLSAWTVAITAAGREVLAGAQDAIQLNGIDRWLGGVHLCGADATWRWDEQHDRLVRKGACNAG